MTSLMLEFIKLENRLRKRSLEKRQGGLKESQNPRVGMGWKTNGLMRHVSEFRILGINDTNPNDVTVLEIYRDSYTTKYVKTVQWDDYFEQCRRLSLPPRQSIEYLGIEAESYDIEAVKRKAAQSVLARPVRQLDF